MNDNTTLPGSVLAGWFAHMESPLSGEIQLGVIRVTIPSSASADDCWDVHIVNPSGTDQGSSVSIVAGPDGSLLCSSPDDLRADVDGDDCVNVMDLLAIRANLGREGSEINPPEADINGDEVVNVMDLLGVRADLGKGSGCE